jgi:hypothetical protein
MMGLVHGSFHRDMYGNGSLVDLADLADSVNLTSLISPGRLSNRPHSPPLQ